MRCGCGAGRGCGGRSFLELVGEESGCGVGVRPRQTPIMNHHSDISTTIISAIIAILFSSILHEKTPHSLHFGDPQLWNQLTQYTVCR